MDTRDADWVIQRVSEHCDTEASVDSYAKQEDSNLGSSDGRVESNYDESNLGGEDDYMSNMAVYDGYDSYNDSTITSEEDDENSRSSANNIRVSSITPISRPKFRFMNGKDGMASCERCGTVGIKHAFYSKSKRFCSLSCSRSFATAQREGKPSTPLQPARQLDLGQKLKGFRQNKKQHARTAMQAFKPNMMADQSRGFDWGPYLMVRNTEAASVACFPHTPMSDCWSQIREGMKVEVVNYDTNLPNDIFWIATVMKVAGYKPLLRYEGFGNDGSHDFWSNLCTPDVHQVGWCATMGRPLVPPKSIQHKCQDWKDYLVKRLTGASTLPNNFYSRVVECIGNHKFEIGTRVEVVDKNCVSAMRVAAVDEIVGGRLRLTYEDSTDENDDFWCHMHSPLLHHVGWAMKTGHKIHASADYKAKCALQKYDANDSTPDMFPKEKDPPAGLKFTVGMKLEAIDPLNLSAICVATVMKVLKNNYLMIGIDGSMCENNSDWFCYHATSPCIFPAGFCEVNSLELTPPRGYKGRFQWYDYLRMTKSAAAPVKLFDKEIPKHGFKVGMKIEAVDLMEPRLICVGTVTKVVGRLLRVHFDGWDNEYDQWVDCHSPDIYPTGWCEIMNYPLEGPRSRGRGDGGELPNPSQSIPRKRKGKTQIYKGPRKKRKSKPGGRPLAHNFRLLPSVHIDSKQGLGCPPHKQLSSEAVAATLPPLPPLVDPLHPPQPTELAVKEESAASADVTLIPGPETPPLSSPEAKSGLGEVSLPPPLPPSAPPTPQQPPPPVKPPVVSGLASQSPAVLSALLKPLAKPPSSVAVRESLASSVLPAQSASLGAGTAPTSDSAGAVAGSGAAAAAGAQGGTEEVLSLPAHLEGVSLDRWTVVDVCQFLQVNNCTSHCEGFSKKSIDGRKLLDLTKEQLVSLTGMKVGPSFRIFHMVQQLRNRFGPSKDSASLSKQE